MAIKPDYFADETLHLDLRGKTVRGGAFAAGSEATQFLIQLIMLPILGRLLSPADFGLVAMVAVVTGFAAMFVDAGLSIATIQREQITSAQVTNLFWLATGLGCVVAAVVAVLSPMIAWFYGEPRLIPITLALTTTFVFSGLTLQHQALLQRTMRFRDLAIVQILSVFAGQVVAVAIAWNYRTYWALVWMPIVTAMVRAVATWLACRWCPGFPQRGTNVGPMVSFGAYLMGSNFANYFARNMDNVLIGRYWGSASLGYYDKAYRLLLFPLQKINGPVSRVAVPALSRLRNQPDRYRRFFRKGVHLTAFAQVPLVIFAFVEAEDIILTLLGNQWGDAIPIFQSLLPAALVGITAPASTWVYLSWGHTDRLVKATVINSFLIVLGFLFALPYGPFGVATSFSVTSCLIRVPNILYCFHNTPLRLRDMLEPLGQSVIAAIGAGLIVSMIGGEVDCFASPPLRVLIAAGLYSFTYPACFIMLPGGMAFLRSTVELTMDIIPRRQR